jgi:hypothetical protein
MASTYSTSLGLELIGQGEQSGTWGITTNNNFGTLVEQAITGVQTITMGDATYTLTTYQGAADESRNAVLVLGGTVTTPQNLIAPAVEKVYLIKNITGSTITIKTTGGVGAALSNGTYAQVYCDGTDFYNATPSGNNVTGDLAVTGSITAGANVTAVNRVTANVVSATTYLGITGRIIQTVQAFGSVAYTTGGSYTATGHVASITPTSISSKILVMLSSAFWQTNGFGGNSFLALYKNSTNLIGSNDWVVFAAPGQNAYGSVAFQYLDAPATTSSIAYQPFIKADQGGTTAYNATGTAVLTLLEIL